MDAETLTKIISLGTGHKWLPLAIVVVTWLGALARKESLVPLGIPARLMPLFVTGLGLVSGVLLNIQDGGLAWKDAAVTGLIAAFASGFLYDLIVKGAFGGFSKLPRWLKWLALIPHTPSDSERPPPPPKTPSDLSGLFILLGIGAMFGSVSTVSCTAAQRKLVSDFANVAACIEDHQGKPDAQVVALCSVENVPPEDILRALQKVRAARKAAYAQGKLEGEHLGCGPTGPTKDGGQ